MADEKRSTIHKYKYKICKKKCIKKSECMA